MSLRDALEIVEFASRNFIVEVMLWLSVLGATVACAQTPYVDLAALRSDVDSVRMQAFYHLSKDAAAASRPGEKRLTLTDYARRVPGVAAALIALLERENRKMFMQGGTTSEEFSNYYGDLIGQVAALGDTRAVTALAGAVTTGAMAEDGLVALGEPALPALLRAAQSKDNLTRNAVVAVVAKILQSDTLLSAASRRASIDVLVAGLRDPWPPVQLSAIEGLEKHPDPLAYESMRALAIADSSGPDTFGFRQRVRAAARLWLEKHNPQRVPKD